MRNVDGTHLHQLRVRVRTDRLAMGTLCVAGPLAAVSPEVRHLVGHTFTIADLKAASLLALVLQPPEIQYPLRVQLPSYVQQYRATLLKHPAAQWATGIYRLHRGRSAEAPVLAQC
jgi:hypothetical protein